MLLDLIWRENRKFEQFDKKTAFNSISVNYENLHYRLNRDAFDSYDYEAF